MSIKKAAITSFAAIMTAACATPPEEPRKKTEIIFTSSDTPDPVSYKLENPCETRRAGGLEDKSDGAPKPCLALEN